MGEEEEEEEDMGVTDVDESIPLFTKPLATIPGQSAKLYSRD